MIYPVAPRNKRSSLNRGATAFLIAIIVIVFSAFSANTTQAYWMATKQPISSAINTGVLALERPTYDGKPGGRSVFLRSSQPDNTRILATPGAVCNPETNSPMVVKYVPGYGNKECNITKYIVEDVLLEPLVPGDKLLVREFNTVHASGFRMQAELLVSVSQIELLDPVDGRSTFEKEGLIRVNARNTNTGESTGWKPLTPDQKIKLFNITPHDLVEQKILLEFEVTIPASDQGVDWGKRLQNSRLRLPRISLELNQVINPTP